MSEKYKIHNDGLYFVTFSVVGWIDVFIRKVYQDILIDSLQYCQKHKGLKIYCYCIMPSHVHLVFKSTIQKPQELIRDFKSFTSKEMIKLIIENKEESRKEWLIHSFKKSAHHKSNTWKNQFWQHDNHPIELWSAAVIDQKINYIHDNPVSAGFVENPYEYLYSSSRDYFGIKGLVEVIVI